jgi:aminoglycoside 3-N-acetyltransferase
MSKEVIGKEEIRKGLEALGIGPGDKLLVHSGLRMMGWVDGGANAVIDVLLSLVTSSGTIMMPVFTIPPAELFDPRSTPTTLGVIAETFRKHDDVIRSLHPSHSVAVWGKDSAKYADLHLNSTALGVGSPVHGLIEANGDILLLGVGHWANSAVHVAEAAAKVPYLDIPYSEEYAKPLAVKTADGSIREVPSKENPGCSINFVAAEAPLKNAGLLKYQRVGDALFQRVDGSGSISLLKDILTRNPDALLCSWDLCPFCPRARAVI